MTPRTENLIARDTGGPTISAGYPRALVDFAAGKGVDRDALLSHAGLTAADLEAQDNRIAFAAYVVLLDAAAELAGDPALALHFGQAVRMQDISIVGLICEACETTADVGRELNRYAALVIDDECCEPAALTRGKITDEGVWIEFTHPVFVAYPRMVEAEFARLIWNGREMFANSTQFQQLKYPRVVHFVHNDPGHGAECARVFDAPVHFGRARNAMLVDTAFLSLRQPPVNRYVFAVLSERADALLKSLEANRTVRGRVERLIAPILHTGVVSMDLIAERMGASRQTLYRNLKAEGVTFEQVLDDLRHRLAVSYLAGRKVSVNETAYLVGFSEPAAFSRAFKRWTGASPRASRKAS